MKPVWIVASVVALLLALYFVFGRAPEATVEEMPAADEVVSEPVEETAAVEAPAPEPEAEAEAPATPEAEEETAEAEA